MASILIPLAFLLGSIPCGILVASVLQIGDPRKHGSGNIGAANMTRLGGKKAGILTFVLDFAKGAIPVSVVLLYFPAEQWAAPLCALAAVTGHCYSIFLKGNGGKGVATMTGAFFPLTPIPLLVALCVWVLSFAVSRITSLSAMFALVALLLAQRFFQVDNYVLIVSALCCLMIVRRHEANLWKLLYGKELDFKTER